MLLFLNFDSMVYSEDSCQTYSGRGQLAHYFSPYIFALNKMFSI